MRALLLLAILPACDVQPIDPIDLGGCDMRLLPGECVDADHPFLFMADNDPAIATGGATRVQFISFDGEFELRSSDPSILQLETDAAGMTFDRGVADGSARIDAFGPTGQLLDSLVVEVEPVVAVDFAYDPAGDQPLTQLSALPGATENLRILPRGADGAVLGGAGSLIAFSFTGPIESGSPSHAERRLGSFELFGEHPRELGFQTAVRFDAIGAATIEASITDAGGATVELGTLPIDVIAAAAQVSLVPGHPTTVTDFVEVVGFVGQDAAGVPVAGLIGDFTAAPANLVQIDSPHAGETFLQTLAPGTVTITGTLPDRVVTAQLVIEPRP